MKEPRSAYLMAGTTIEARLIADVARVQAGGAGVGDQDCAGIVALGPQIVAMAEDDCVLFLWALNSMLEHALAVIRAWGFTYKTKAFTWAKQTRTGAKWHMGLGFWSRQNTEDVLLATRGNPKRFNTRAARSVPQLLIAPVQQHSQKPDEVYGLIERMVPGPYVKLFSRKSRPGWDVAISNQAGLLDHGPVNTRRQPSSLVGKDAAQGPRQSEICSK